MMRSPLSLAFPRVLAALLLALTCACGSSLNYAYTGAPGIYTLTNLHFDAGRNRIYSTHYLLEPMIPVCTQVRVEAVSAKKAVFTVNGKEYSYFFEKYLQRSPQQQLDLVFGPKCPDLTQLSEVDQKGIKAGSAALGMTRRGVEIANGVPPDHVNRPDSKEWKYWVNRFSTRRIVFDGNVVSGIHD